MSMDIVMQGIVGGTYDRYLEGEAAVSKPEDQLYIPDDVRPLILPYIVTFLHISRADC